MLLSFVVLYNARTYRNEYLKQSNEFSKKYKCEYLTPCFKNLTYTYNANNQIDEITLSQSELFLSFDSKDGNDTVSGNKNGVKFSFGDITLKCNKSELFWNIVILDKAILNLILIFYLIYLGLVYIFKFLRSSKNAFSKNKFKGLLFIADFNKTISSKTFIISSKKAPKATKNLKLITLDNSVFNNSVFNDKFRVYSNDVQNTMYLLSQP